MKNSVDILGSEIIETAKKLNELINESPVVHYSYNTSF
jgi:hypothetical protein